MLPRSTFRVSYRQTQTNQGACVSQLPASRIYMSLGLFGVRAVMIAPQSGAARRHRTSWLCACVISWENRPSKAVFHPSRPSWRLSRPFSRHSPTSLSIEPSVPRVTRGASALACAAYARRRDVIRSTYVITLTACLPSFFFPVLR